MFKEFSKRINDEYYKAAVKKMKSMYSSCKSNNAWEKSNVMMYQKCSDEIIKSTMESENITNHIEAYSIHQIGSSSFIQADFDHILADIEFQPSPRKAFFKVINFIKLEFGVLTQTFSCKEIEGCLETTREVIIRLKMIQLGLYGLGQMSAGLLLAHHNTILGPYFGDIGGTNWPHIPLHMKPTALEEDFHQLLTNITFSMSNETLENVSILDLPAFGSTVGTLRKNLKKHYNWPVETNHAILANNPGVNFTSIFGSYKTLVEDWGQHMDLLGRNGGSGRFTSEMANNQYMNFTKFIKDDMRTFLIALAGMFSNFPFVFIAMNL